jgi:1,2-diacylglycerol 3-beta-glucosyltransferase
MKKVLIIEDEAIISFGYRLQLEQMGLEVIGSARSSDEALALLEKERPDVIIMDVYIKGDLNGLQLAQRIHEKDPIPVIFLTASTKPEIVEGIRALTGCHYLLKPIDTDSLSGLLNATVPITLGPM